MRILLVNGPNLNMLGRRQPEIYGSMTLQDIVDRVTKRAQELDIEIVPFQANSEGAIVDFLQENGPGADGVLINAGALTHYGLSLRDAFESIQKPFVEVHISNIHARDEYHRHSKISFVATGVIAGLGPFGYIAALHAIANMK